MPGDQLAGLKCLDRLRLVPCARCSCTCLVPWSLDLSEFVPELSVCPPWEGFLQVSLAAQAWLPGRILMRMCSLQSP